MNAIGIAIPSGAGLFRALVIRIAATLGPTRSNVSRALLGGLGFAVIAVAVAMPATAQSLQQVEAQLYKRERFFQPVNQPAPKFELQDADGHPWSLDGLKGKVVVLHFIDAHCKDKCPLQSDLIGRIQEMINQTPMRDKVQFVSITVNPSQDTPDILKAYGPIHGLDPVNWLFLTTRPGQPEDATRQIAERFGLKFTRTDDGQFIHGVVTHIIDREGMLRGKFHGLEFDPTNLIAFVNALVNDVHKPGDIAAIPASQPSTPVSTFDPTRWIPIALLALAAAWLIGALTFFRQRRKALQKQRHGQQGSGDGDTRPSAAE